VRADVAVDCTGSARVWESLPGLVAAGGEVLLFGGCAPGARVTFDAERLHYSEISLVGAFHSTPADARRALDLLAQGKVRVEQIFADRGPLTDLPRFLEAQRRGDGIRYAVLA